MISGSPESLLELEEELALRLLAWRCFLLSLRRSLFRLSLSTSSSKISFLPLRSLPRRLLARDPPEDGSARARGPVCIALDSPTSSSTTGVLSWWCEWRRDLDFLRLITRALSLEEERDREREPECLEILISVRLELRPRDLARRLWCDFAPPWCEESCTESFSVMWSDLAPPPRTVDLPSMAPDI